jgi:hypothetical protein
MSVQTFSPSCTTETLVFKKATVLIKMDLKDVLFCTVYFVVIMLCNRFCVAQLLLCCWLATALLLLATALLLIAIGMLLLQCGYHDAAVSILVCFF